MKLNVYFVESIPSNDIHLQINKKKLRLLDIFHFIFHFILHMFTVIVIYFYSEMQ